MFRNLVFRLIRFVSVLMMGLGIFVVVGLRICCMLRRMGYVVPVADFVLCFCIEHFTLALRVCTSLLHCVCRSCLLFAIACHACIAHLHAALTLRICASHFCFVALVFRYACVLSHSRVVALTRCCARALCLRVALALRVLLRRSRASCVCVFVSWLVSPLACVVRRTFSHAILSFAACQRVCDLRSAR